VVWLKVYKLKLRENNAEVAVKVQRPDMLEGILKDLFILRNMAIVVEKIKVFLTKQRPYDVDLLDTFAKASMYELDYE